MAKKKDGITDLTKLLVTAAGKFTPNQYKNLTSTIFALLNGVNYGYTELGPRFLQDAQDIYDIHTKDLKKTSFFKNHKPDPSMVSNFKKKKGKKQIQTHDNVINFEHYKFWSPKNDA
jgi:hypothetical protein